MRPNGHRCFRSAATLVVTCMLLVHAIATSLHAPLAGPRSAGGPDSIALQSIVLCTAHGLQTVALGPDGNPIEGPPAPPPLECQACLALGSGALDVPSVVAVKAPRAASSRFTLARGIDLPAMGFAGLPRNRGPPTTMS